MSAIELDAASPQCSEAASLLTAGHVILLRNIDAIRQIRNAMIEHAAFQRPGSRDELVDFYERGTIPNLPALQAISQTIKIAREQRLISECFAPLIAGMGFGEPIRLDGGIPRLVLPRETIETARVSGQFADEDFQRLKADGPTEVFMPRPANIHRDYNRQHFLFQCNFWFPLHDLDENEVLRIFPEHYRDPIYDMDATEENLRTIGEPMRYTLKFGDAIVFHGEHLHTSPIVSSNSRRHSYDLRVASHCYDDTRHYRDLFLDIRNFQAPPNRQHSLLNREKDSSALSALLEAEVRDDLDTASFARIYNIFEQNEFAEDRYLILARCAAATAPTVALNALRIVVDRSPHWFWITEAGKAFQEMGDNAQAALAFCKALPLAESHTTLTNFMPIIYPNPSTQPLPHATQQYLKNALGKLRL